MSNLIYELPDEKFIQLIKECHNVGEVLFKLKLSVTGNTWGYNEVRRRMKELGIDGNSFVGMGGFKGKSEKFGDLIDEKELFVENCRHTRYSLRKRIIDCNLIEYKCAICGISSWNNRPISLELDHINGINNDNRLDNLRFLCPNCHSQTSTYGSRNSNRAKCSLSNCDREKILTAYKELHNRDLVYKQLGFSRSAIKRVLDSDCSVKNAQNQKFVIRYDQDHNEICRWGSISECCKSIFEANETDAKTLQGVRGRFLRRMKYFQDEMWLNSYWRIVDAGNI